MAKVEPSLSSRIVRLREMAAISSRELDGMAGLRACHSRAIENGTKANVTSSTLNAIARVFGVSMDWLYEGQGTAPTPERVRASVSRARRRMVEGAGQKGRVTR
jgi:transcriptional regulator with XRE-family HTH domain